MNSPDSFAPHHRDKSAWVAAAVAGCFAGTLATVLQLLLWWLTAANPFEKLLRDARLTAALAMGRTILVTEPRWRWDVFLAATLIHYGLSTAYAALALVVVSRFRTLASLLAGGVYGTVIYVLNLHGLTLIFPWFSAARGWDTLLVHVAFGIAVTGACSVLRSIKEDPSTATPTRCEANKSDRERAKDRLDLRV